MTAGPTAALRLHLIRHGQTDWNAIHRVQGQLDIPLNDVGRHQAVALAGALAGAGIAAIVSSDLMRAGQTADVLAIALGLDVRLDARLRERAFGVLEGTLYRDPTGEFGHLWEELRQAPEARPPGGESAADLRRRVAACLDDLLAAPPADVVAVVGHGGTVLAALARLGVGDALSGARGALANCSDAVVDVAPGGRARLVSAGAPISVPGATAGG